MNRYRWQILPPISEAELARWQGVSPLLVQLLLNRGIADPLYSQGFLAGDERLVGDPFLLPDLAQGVARIYRALLGGETIAIYGDFDADGVTGTALLVKALSKFGNKVIPYIPHRLDEGYGLNKPALESLRSQGVSLVITVDCGITSIAEARYASRLGLDLIITDHHSVLADLPAAVAVINPKRPDSRYPFRELAGVGVAYKLLQGLLIAISRERDEPEFLDLVALGTVTDMCPLLGENRYLVKQGLELLNRVNRPGLRELVVGSGLKPGSLDTHSIMYVLGPRLNAAGRLDHAMSSYQLLVTEQAEEARQLAAVLEEKNAQRQRLTAETLKKAREKLSSTDLSLPLLMVGDQDYPPGVVGIIASRLVEEFRRPVVVLQIGEKASRGSIRSIPEFNIIAALTECQELLLKFGGHSQAAGFTLPSSNIQHLHERLVDIARRTLEGLDLTPSLTIDAEVKLSRLGGDVMRLIERLAPFGRANPAPVFLSRGVRVVESRAVGANGAHLRFKFNYNNTVWQGIGFDLGSLAERVPPLIDIVYNLEVDEWRNTPLLELNILDLAPSQQG